MAEQLERDSLAEEHSGDDDDAWLDLHVPRLVHQQLAAFGGRMGLTADGYAKLLLFQALHPLLAAEPSMVDQPDAPLSDADVSRELWAQQMAQYAGALDTAPAPREVHADSRVYCAEDFEWEGGHAPTHPWLHVLKGGQFAVRMEAPPI